MSVKNPTKATTAAQRAVIRALSQSVAAELIGRPASWLRDNPHHGARDEDGAYDGPALVAFMLSNQPPADLADEQLERVLQVVESISPAGDRAGIPLSHLEAIVREHGPAGLAAIGSALVEHLRESSKYDSVDPLPKVEVFVEEARADHAREARGREAIESGRMLVICAGCEKYRLGRKWKRQPLPPGYHHHPQRGLCPKCVSTGRV